MSTELLSTSMNNSLTDECIEIVANLSEIALDSIMEDGLLKEVPIISSAISMYKIGCTVHERKHIKNLVAFLNSINKSIIDEDQLNRYRESISNDVQKRSKELEYVLIIIERYISQQKSEMLGKLYLAYLDNEINWTQFCDYSEMIDRFLMSDIDFLMKMQNEINIPSGCDERVLRLEALGMVVDGTNKFPMHKRANGNFSMEFEDVEKASSPERHYYKTNTGKQFVDIMHSYKFSL